MQSNLTLKKRSVVGFLLLVLAFMTIFSFTAIASESHNKIKIVFSKELSTEELSQLIEENNLLVRELFFEQSEFGGGYTPRSGEDIRDSVKLMNIEHKKFLRYIIDKTKDKIAKANNNEEKERYLSMLSPLVVSEEVISNNVLKVSAISVDSDINLSGIKNNDVIKNIDYPNKLKVTFGQALSRALSTIEKSMSPVKALASINHESWAPYAGGTDVNQSATYNDFYFNDVSGFGSNSTYEHESQVYETEYADYNNYWSSNLPYKYYDTPFSDDIDNFTVGTSKDSQLEEYKQYWTYMSLTAGTKNTSTIRIKGQKGHRSPSWCHSTWCIFADATTGSMAAGVNVPNLSMSWSY